MKEMEPPKLSVWINRKNGGVGELKSDLNFGCEVT